MHKYLAGFLLCACMLQAAARDEQNIVYGTPASATLKLDLHVPEGSGPFPTAILVHGGGFDQGSKSTNVKPLFTPLSEAGFAWFSIDYRLAPAAQFPQAIEDVYSAIQWVKKHAQTYHVDVSRLVLIGESAGGFLVNYAGTHSTPDTAVAAVVDFYGPSDYGKLAQLRQSHPELFDMATIRRHAENGGGIHFFGVKELNSEGMAKLKTMAPISAVQPKTPPFLCIHGTRDDQVVLEQSTDFCSAIRAAGSTCELIKIEGGAHGMSRWQAPEMQHWKPEMIAWLRKTLKVKTSS